MKARSGAGRTRFGALPRNERSPRQGINNLHRRLFFGSTFALRGHLIAQPRVVFLDDDQIAFFTAATHRYSMSSSCHIGSKPLAMAAKPFFS